MTRQDTLARFEDRACEIYSQYPRKLGKKKGVAKLRTILKSEDDVAKVTEAVKNYRAFCERSGSEERYIKHFTTFLSEWEDWLDPNHGGGESFGKSKIIYPGDEDDEIRV